MTPLLFDSCALLRYLQKGTGSERVREILTRGRDHSVELLLNVINFGEVLYTTQRRFGAEARMKAFVAVQQMGVGILPCPNAVVYAAAELKAAYSILTPMRLPWPQP